jgi:hypothetical protein
MYYEDEGMSLSPRSNATAIKSLATIGSVPQVALSFSRSGTQKDDIANMPPKWLNQNRPKSNNN